MGGETPLWGSDRLLAPGKKLKTPSFRGRRRLPEQQKQAGTAPSCPHAQRRPYPRISSALCSRLRTSRNTRVPAAAAAMAGAPPHVQANRGHRGQKRRHVRRWRRRRRRRGGPPGPDRWADTARQPTAPPAGRRTRCREISTWGRERFQTVACVWAPTKVVGGAKLSFHFLLVGVARCVSLSDVTLKIRAKYPPFTRLGRNEAGRGRGWLKEEIQAGTDPRRFESRFLHPKHNLVSFFNKLQYIFYEPCQSFGSFPLFEATNVQDWPGIASGFRHDCSKIETVAKM